MITKFKITCAAALLAVQLVSTGPAYAAEAESIPVVDEKQAALAAFTEYYVPTELSTAGALANYERQFLRISAADPKGIALEEWYPGITQYAMVAGQAVIEKNIRAIIPQIHSDIAAYMDQKFALAELKKINTYYASESAQASMKTVINNMDGDEIADKAIAKMRDGDGTATIDKNDVLVMAEKSIAKSLSNQQFKDMAQFMSTPTGRKFILNADGLLDIVSIKMNVAANQNVSEAQAAVILSVRDFIVASN